MWQGFFLIFFAVFGGLGFAVLRHAESLLYILGGIGLDIGRSAHHGQEVTFHIFIFVIVAWILFEFSGVCCFIYYSLHFFYRAFRCGALPRGDPGAT